MSDLIHLQHKNELLMMIIGFAQHSDCDIHEPMIGRCTCGLTALKKAIYYREASFHSNYLLTTNEGKEVIEQALLEDKEVFDEDYVRKTKMWRDCEGRCSLNHVGEVMLYEIQNTKNNKKEYKSLCVRAILKVINEGFKVRQIFRKEERELKKKGKIKDEKE